MYARYSNIRFTSSFSSIVKNQLSDVSALVSRVLNVKTRLVERLVNSELELHPLADVLPSRVGPVVTELVVRIVLLDPFNVALTNPDRDRVANVDHARASAAQRRKPTVTEATA